MTEEQFQCLLAERQRCIDAAMAEYERKKFRRLRRRLASGLDKLSGQLERWSRRVTSPSIGGAGTMKL